MSLKNLKTAKMCPKKKIPIRLSQILRAFFTANYIMELFEADWYFRDIKSDPVPSFDSTSSTFTKFFEVLLDPHWA
jgi:hypothetical protein